MIWHDNTEYVCKKGYECLWMLMRLRSLGASESELVDVYEKQIRSVLELAVADRTHQIKIKLIGEGIEDCLLHHTWAEIYEL